MTFKEYQEEDLKLAGEIAEYEIRNSELEREIAMNNETISGLKLQRCRLTVEYHLELTE